MTSPVSLCPTWVVTDSDLDEPRQSQAPQKLLEMTERPHAQQTGKLGNAEMGHIGIIADPYMEPFPCGQQPQLLYFKYLNELNMR